jgi:hypothetical protein
MLERLLVSVYFTGTSAGYLLKINGVELSSSKVMATRQAPCYLSKCRGTKSTKHLAFPRDRSLITPGVVNTSRATKPRTKEN